MIVGVTPYRFDYPMSINSLFPLVLPHKCSPPTDWSCSNLNCVVLQPMSPILLGAQQGTPLTVACAQSSTSWSICRSDSDITNVACLNQCCSLNCNTCNQSIHRPINVGLWHSFDCQCCTLNSIQHHSLNLSYVHVSSVFIDCELYLESLPTGSTTQTALNTSINSLSPPYPMFTANWSMTLQLELHTQLWPMSPDVMHTSQCPMALPPHHHHPPPWCPARQPPNHT